MQRTAQFLALVALAAALAATAAAQNVGSAALGQAVAATQAAKVDYAFDVEITSSKRNWRARYDPRATPRVRLLSPSRDSMARDERRAFDSFAENVEGVSWCASEHIGRVANVRELRSDESTITYAFQPTRESIRGEQARRYADRMRGEFTITRNNPDITTVRLYTPEGFSPMPLVRLDHMNIVIRCATAPNGRRYAAQTVSEARGSAFGQTFDERSVQRTSNLSAP